MKEEKLKENLAASKKRLSQKRNKDKVAKFNKAINQKDDVLLTTPSIDSKDGRKVKISKKDEKSQTEKAPLVKSDNKTSQSTDTSKKIKESEVKVVSEQKKVSVSKKQTKSAKEENK